MSPSSKTKASFVTTCSRSLRSVTSSFLTTPLHKTLDALLTDLERSKTKTTVSTASANRQFQKSKRRLQRQSSKSRRLALHCYLCIFWPLAFESDPDSPRRVIATPRAAYGGRRDEKLFLADKQRADSVRAGSVGRAARASGRRRRRPPTRPSASPDSDTSPGGDPLWPFPQRRQLRPQNVRATAASGGTSHTRAPQGIPIH